MTCIIAAKDPISKEICLAGDSAGISNYDISLRKDSKIFMNGGLFFGFTDSFRMGQLLKYELQVPDSKPSLKDFEEQYGESAIDVLEKKTHRWMCGPFIRSVRECFDKHGFMKVYDSREFGGQFIVICNNSIFTIWSNFQVGYEYRPVSAIGCGAKYAIGAYMASSGDIKNRIENAVKISSECSCGVSKPFTIFKISGEVYEKTIIC